MAQKKQAAKEAPDPGEPSFDARLARLEAIVHEMEEGGLGLEATIERYREGVDLLEGCRGVLAGFRQQVEELTRGAEAALAPYDDDPDV
jgi:exodeoxyribonuclease VII small subunit